jgi:hypothetical protein
MGQGFLNGINLYLKMQGISDERQRNELARKMTEMHIKGLESTQAQNVKTREAFASAFQPEQGDFEVSNPERGTAWIEQRVLPALGQAGAYNEYFDLAKEITGAKKTEKPIGFTAGQPVWTSQGWSTAPGGESQEDPVIASSATPWQDDQGNLWITTRTKSGKINNIPATGPQEAGPSQTSGGITETPLLTPSGQMKGKITSGNIPSAGNAVDLAIKRKFGSDYLKDPMKGLEADKWLATPEGIGAVRSARDDLTPPAYSFQATSEGIVPGITRGAGAGTLGEPTKYRKPLSDAQLTKVGELNAVLANIEKTKVLYGYGTATEHEEWVGPLAGRKGGVESKFLGTASPDQVKFYAYVKDMQDALLRARSGAQINEQEYARLVAFLPEPNLPPVTFKAKLERFQEATQTVMDERLAAFEQGGLGVGGLKQGGNSIPNSGHTGGTPGKTIMKQFISPSTGKTKYVYSDGTEEIR